MKKLLTDRHFDDVIKKQARCKGISLCELEDVLKPDISSGQPVKTFTLPKLNCITSALDIHISALLFEIDDTPLEKTHIKLEL